MPVEDLYYKKYLKYKNKYLNLQSQMGGMRRGNAMHGNQQRNWGMLRQQGIPAAQPPQRQWMEVERQQAQVEEQLQAAREQAEREQAEQAEQAKQAARRQAEQAEQAARRQAEQAEQAAREQAALRARKKPQAQAQWGAQEKERWIAENEREKEKAITYVLIHITALRNAFTQAQQEAAKWTNENAMEKAYIYVNKWEKDYGKTLFKNYEKLLGNKQYDAAKVYVKGIASEIKQIENDLKRMQEGIQKEENNKEIIINTLFKDSLLTIWDNMRSKNDLISKKIELELGSEIEIHEEDTQYLTKINHVYMSKNIPGDTSDLKKMLQLVQTNNQEEPISLSVVVPQYPDYDDTQFAITGSCKAGEDIEKAVQREILEEIGLFVDIFNITQLDVITTTKNYVKSSVTYFHVKLENSITPSKANLQQAAEMAEMAKMDKVDDDKTKKVCIIMTMTLNERDIKQIYGRKRSTSSDIAGKTIAIIPLEKMIEFTAKAEFPEKKQLYHQRK